MAITILQEPTSPNVSNTNLIYTISSSNVPQFQFRYIADLYYSGSSTRLARFKYPQNSSGTANIDLARPINDYLDYDYNWNIDTITTSSINYKNFEIKFGEEYGTSYSSSVTTFPDIASSSISVLKGNIEYPSIANWNRLDNTVTYQSSSINWNTTYYGPNQPSSKETYFNRQLTNNPNLGIAPANASYNDYSFNFKFTVNWPKECFDSGSNWYVAQPIGTEDLGTTTITGESFSQREYVQAYDDNNELILSLINEWQNISPVPKENVLWNAPVGLSQFAYMTSSVDFFGASALNPLYSSSLQISSSAQWNWYVTSTVTNTYNKQNFYYNEDKGPDTLMSLTSASADLGYRWNRVSSGSTNQFGIIGINPTMWHNKVYPTNCNNEKTRFAFINSFGVWDYYNVYMPTRRSTKIDRKIYEQDRINLDERIATYNVSNRGEKQYYTEYTDEFEITTDILDDKESQWLREMFESSEVYIQSGSDFIPINILNNRETIINNKARNKQFQYTIRYQFSNLREPR